MRVGRGARLGRIDTRWPHQVDIGDDALVLDGTVFDYCHGTWQAGPSIRIGQRTYLGRSVTINVRLAVTIGSDCLIAAGCHLIDHDHGMALHEPMRTQPGPESPIVIGSDVWLGTNVIVLKGVTVGDGAVVAAGAVVNKSIPPAEIWGGVPARKIGARRVD